MTGERVRGLAEANSLLGALPAAARHELADEIGRIGRDVLAAQQRDVARDSGELQAGLSLQLLTDELRVRVGLLNTRPGRSKLYYGRFVENGRRAQTVLVTRHLKRKVRGNGKTSARRMAYEATGHRLRKRGPNAGTPVGSAWKMRVRAMGARPYVYKDRPEIDVAQRLADYWGRTIDRAGGAS